MFNRYPEPSEAEKIKSKIEIIPMPNHTKDNSFEYETKFVLPNANSYSLIQFLKSCCRKDRSYPEGTVSSIYYDTKDWRYISEKINSDYLKTKVRIRWYSDLDSINQFKCSFVEAKYKVGSLREKVRVKTPYTGKWLNTVNLKIQYCS